MNPHSDLFLDFERQRVVSDGMSVYDFLGGAINAAYKNGWDRNVQPVGKPFHPSFPRPSEWTIDWVACLLAAKLAGERFGVIELGAGFGQWSVAAIMAYKACKPGHAAKCMALEAESTHYEWLQHHVERNLGHHTDVELQLLNAAAGFDGAVRFPALPEPSKVYGATYGTHVEGPTREVPCLSLQSIYKAFGSHPVNLLHCDIQGAEADLIGHPEFCAVIRDTRVVLFGTHRSVELHERVRDAVRESGLCLAVDWPRNSTVHTRYGDVQTTDGALLALAEEDFWVAQDWIDFEGLQGEAEPSS